MRKRQLTYCFLVDHWSCWTCKSLWHSTRSPYYPVHNSGACLFPAPQWAPWCCCKGPGPETVLDLDLLFEADWSAGVYWGSVPGLPPLSFSLCGQCPQWCKWIATKSLSHSSRGGKTEVLCPDSYFALVHSQPRLVKEKKKKNKNKQTPNEIPIWIESLFSFHSGREWVLFLQESHFLKCYVIFAKCAFALEQIRAILDNNLNSSSKFLILLFIPPCLTHASFLLVFLSQGTGGCTAVQFLHCTVLFPSTCSTGASAPLS